MRRVIVWEALVQTEGHYFVLVKRLPRNGKSENLAPKESANKRLLNLGLKCILLWEINLIYRQSAEVDMHLFS